MWDLWLGWLAIVAFAAVPLVPAARTPRWRRWRAVGWCVLPLFALGWAVFLMLSPTWSAWLIYPALGGAIAVSAVLLFAGGVCVEERQSHRKGDGPGADR